jgi:hypothetical protein
MFVLKIIKINIFAKLILSYQDKYIFLVKNISFITD